MNSPELPTPGSHHHTITKFSSGFKYHGYTVSEANTLDSISDGSIVILADHGMHPWWNLRTGLPASTENSLGYRSLKYLADKYPNCVYLCWHYCKPMEPFPFKKFILTGEPRLKQGETDSPDFQIATTYFGSKDFVPLTFASFMTPDMVGNVKRDVKYNGCFIGCTYKPDWVSGLQNIVYIAETPVPEQDRVNYLLSSKIAFGFHNDANILNHCVVERVFEGMSLGCVVISDNPAASYITGGIVQFAENKDEFMRIYSELLNDEHRMYDLQQKGYEWSKNNGLYVHTAKNFLNKIEQLYGKTDVTLIEASTQ